MSQAFETIKNNDVSHVMQSYGRYPVALHSGHNAHVTDVDGKEYVDLLAGIAVCGLGHCNDELCATLEKQAHTIWHTSNLFYQEPQPELARRLEETAHFGKAFFCNSGAEANEALIKLARRYMTRVLGKEDAYEIITLSGCFHGRTLGTLAATGRAGLMDGFTPVAGGFKQVPAGDLDALKDAMSEKTCAVLLEVVQGEGGVIPLPADYVQAVEALCREKGVLFCCDEVQAGMCRTGRFWAFQTCNVKPDIISVAKSLANGLPMGAILATDEVARAFVPGSHATTFGGSPLVAAVACKTVEIMVRDNLAARAEKLGNALMDRAKAFMAANPGKIKEVRGKGLFIGIELTGPAKSVWEELLKRGFICNLCHEVTLRLLPPLTIGEEDLSAFMDALEDILASYKA